MQWRGAAVDPDVEYPDPETWTDVTVPGRPEEFAGAEAVAYRTTFEDPRSSLEQHAVLDLRGVYADTTVYVDGTAVASHDTYFEPLRVPLDDHLGDETDVRIVCRRPTDGFAGVYGTDLVADHLSVPGIWWGANLRTYQGTYVDDMVARPTLDDDVGTVTVRTTVVAGEDLDGRITFSVRPAGQQRSRGMMERAPIEAGAGDRVTVEHTLTVRDPSLWWPADLGEPNRYVIRAKVGGVERTVTTGFSSIRFADGELTVNGTRVTARGINALDATEPDVRRAREVNATLLRTHAHPPPPAVAEACAEAGVLLWVDLPLSGPETVEAERGRELATAIERRYGRLPSLAAVGVHDDPVDPFASRLGGGAIDRLRFRWRTWRAGFDGSTAVAIGDALPESLPSFPVVGPPGVGADATTLYPGWQYGDLGWLEWLLERYPETTAVAEFGVGPRPEGDPRTLKRLAESLRRHRLGVVAAFALRDAGGPDVGVFEADGDPGPAVEALAAAYEPVQATLADPTPGRSPVVILNDRDTPFTGTLSWESPAGDGQTDVTINAHGHAEVTTLTLPAAGERLRLRLALPDRTVDNEYVITGTHSD